MTILDQLAPDLSKQLRTIRLEKRNAIIAIACRNVSCSIENLETPIVALVENAAERNALSVIELAALREFGELADERYFAAKENGEDEQLWRNWFAKARLAAALCSLYEGEDGDGWADAMYELCFVQEDSANVIGLVKSLLATT